MKAGDNLVDFHRNVVCLLGCPFDVVDMERAVELVRESAALGSRCFVSTANVNWIVSAHEDPPFRDAVLQSQLCVADGVPIIWIARLLGLRLRTRVSGAGLFESLCSSPARPAVRVYFFGGAEGVAQIACDTLNAKQCGVQCVGHDSPGFGSVESLSDEARIRKINEAAADFVIVSLGAAKGQAWIQRNRHRLTAPLVCHLGAVVNFVAGTVKRAPTWMQHTGLEWAWRIWEEPSLWRRYAKDAFKFVALFAECVLPLLWRRIVNGLGPKPKAPSVGILRGEAVTQIMLAGAWTGEHERALIPVLVEAAASEMPVSVDVTELSQIDATIMGKLLLLCAHQKNIAKALYINGASEDVRAQFRYHGAGFMLSQVPVRVLARNAPIPKNT